MQYCSIVIKKFEYYSSASIIFIVDQWVCPGFAMILFSSQSQLDVLVEMEKKNYSLTEVVDFVTKSEDSSNLDSDEEEEILIIPFIKRAEAETDCNSDILDDKGLAHHKSCRFLLAPYLTNTIK